MLTDTGIEGGAVYALAAELRDAVEREGVAVLEVDLRPDWSGDRLRDLPWRVRAAAAPSPPTWTAPSACAARRRRWCARCWRPKSWPMGRAWPRR